MENDLLQFVRKPRWAWGIVRRILWYALWTVVFILLVVANLTSGIAPTEFVILVENVDEAIGYAFDVALQAGRRRERNALFHRQPLHS